MNLRAGLPIAVAVLAAAFASCGGGGGGGGTGGPPPVTFTPTPPPGIITPTPTPAPGAGAPNALGVQLLPATTGNVITARIAASAADDLAFAQAASTPALPASGVALAQYGATVTDSAGIAASVQRAPASDRSALLRQRITENRAFERADRLRERTFSMNELRATMGTVRTDRRAAQSVRTTRAAPGTVGQTRQFKILTSNIGNSGGCSGGTTAGTYICFTTITATLRAVGAHGNIWVDNVSSPGEYTIPGEFDTIAQKFDAYYATEAAAFAPAFYSNVPPVNFVYTNNAQCDPNGNPLPQSQWVSTDLSGAGGTSIDVVITDALQGTGEGGYYYSVNEITQQLWDCYPAPKPVSNNTSMFVMAGNNYGAGGGPTLPQFNENYWLNTDVPRSMSHELQHLLHAHYKYLRPAMLGQTPTFDDAFLDEGMSMLAEDLAADGVHIDTPRYSYSFLLEPSLFSLTAFTGYQPNPTSTSANPPYGWFSNTAGSYGQAYLFQRYMYDRFGTAEITSIYNSSLSSVGAVAAASGESFAQLYREFAAAVSAQSTNAAGPPYQFNAAIVLRGNVDVPSRRAPPLNVRHLVFGGPQPPELFTNNQPTGFLTLAPGTSGSTFLIDGATLFLPAANGSSGSTITVAVPGAPAYQGASVAGSLPTPPPSST